MKLRLGTLIFLLICCKSAYCKWVSYPDSWTILQKNDYIQNMLLVHYSPTAKFSIGSAYEYMRDKKTHLLTSNAAYLVQRWNGEESQGNLYFFSAIGGVVKRNNQWRFATYAGIASDWETQRIYFSYENRFLYADTVETSIHQRARIGVTPYVGDYDDVHTWLMLQLDYQGGEPQPLVVTPLLRFFWDNKLIELGFSSTRTILFNWILRW